MADSFKKNKTNKKNYKCKFLQNKLSCQLFNIKMNNF